jgi:hypothetical protein
MRERDGAFEDDKHFYPKTMVSIQIQGRFGHIYITSQDSKEVCMADAIQKARSFLMPTRS